MAKRKLSTRADLRKLPAGDLRQRIKSCSASAARTPNWTDNDWEVLECMAELERRGLDPDGGRPAVAP